MDELKKEFEEARQSLSIMKEGSTFNEDISKILTEYEIFVKFLEEVSNTLSFLQRNKIKEILENDTIRNLDEFILDLQKKFTTVENDNRRLLDAVSEIKEQKKILKEQKKAEVEATKSEHLQGKGCSQLTEMELCKQLNFHQTHWAEKGSLKEKLNELRIDAGEIESSLFSRYIQKKKYDALFKSVLKKEKECEALAMINKTLKMKVKRLKIAIEASEISAYHEYQVNSSARQNVSSIVEEVMQQLIVAGNRDLCQEADIEDNDTEFDFLEKIGLMSLVDIQGNENSLANKLKTIERPKSFEVEQSFTDDDPLREQEAEMTMDYVEVFSNLFTAEEYGKAAFHAIYSPKGILRTQQTLQYFKNINKTKNNTIADHKSYLLHYCTLLLATVSIVGKDPTVWEIIECFRCAINESRLDLVEFWIADKKVEVPEPVANLLLRTCVCLRGHCGCKAVQLAEVIFRDLTCHHELIEILLHQGRLATAVNWAYETAHFSCTDYARMLEDDSNCERMSSLISQLHQPNENRQIIVVLVSSQHNKSALTFTKECCKQADVLFTYKDFSQWEGLPALSETFASLCDMEGLTNTGISFVSACMVWYTLISCNEVLNASF